MNEATIERIRAIDPLAGDVAIHVGHDLEVATYTDGINDPANLSLECLTCGTVIEDWDVTPDEYKGGTDGSV